ncbi:hypothetical protein I350_08127 [Cryptococcus amylolentus CBS 6273]|uniref:PX domain-containing protein n=1 Tax=Cryptococcus amylolentus CBS 6273 TaxID=1296118 RepID=A0A1E3J8G1_9TREE|nr:hypothetical protein I350_08127 [Cryptococcus amylolentus CBS 6273]
MSDDASDTSSIASACETWEMITRSPSLLHDDFASFQSDTSSFDWSPLHSLGFKSSSSINTVGKEKKGPGKKSSFKILRRLSHEKEDSSKSESSFVQPPNRKGFLKSIKKINRKKGKDNKQSYDDDSMPASTPASSSPPRPHIQPRRVSEDSLSGFELCSIPRTSFDVMSRFDDAEDDSSFMDTIPKLYLSSPSTASQPSPVQPTTPNSPGDEEPQQRPEIVPMINYARLETIMEVSEDTLESDDAPVPPNPQAPDTAGTYSLDASTYTDGAAGVQSEPIFFGSRHAPLPAGHLASLAFTHILPQGLIPLYELQITWVPNDVRLPASRLNVTRGYGSLSKLADALFQEYHEGSTPYLKSLLADFPKAYDGPTLPQKTEYRAERMQHYFDLLFGIRTRGEEYVLDNVYIMPEFFAILHGDVAERITRDEAWGEWEYTLERRIDIERWERANSGQDTVQRVPASLSNSVPRESTQSLRTSSSGESNRYSSNSAPGEDIQSPTRSKLVESGYWENEPSTDTPPSREILDSGEFTDLIDSFPLHKQHKPVEVRVIATSVHAPSSETPIRCSSSATALSIDPSASLEVSSDFHSPSCSSDKSGLYETPNSSVTDLGEFAGTGKADEHVRHVVVASKALATFMSSQPTPEKLALGEEGVIFIDLTTRFFFNTIPVLISTKESWRESLVRIYSALRLPFNSMSLKGDVEVLGAIHLGVPHDEEVELKSKADLERWLGIATEKRIWVEDW